MWAKVDKARMRAKERNLQATRDNYQQMQEMCIQKITELEQAVSTAKHKLEQATHKREQEVGRLKAELHQ